MQFEKMLPLAMTQVVEVASEAHATKANTFFAMTQAVEITLETQSQTLFLMTHCDKVARYGKGLFNHKNLFSHNSKSIR